MHRFEPGELLKAARRSFSTTRPIDAQIQSNAPAVFRRHIEEITKVLEELNRNTRPRTIDAATMSRLRGIGTLEEFKVESEAMIASIPERSRKGAINLKNFLISIRDL